MTSRFATIAVYIVASGRNGTLYTGVTSDLAARVFQHKQQTTDSFAKRYGCTRLVWFEVHGDMRAAIQRETNIKRYLRAWKLRIIEEMNPEWRDLSEGWWDEGLHPPMIQEADSSAWLGSRDKPENDKD